MHFLLDTLEGETPPWTPGYAWPNLYLLSVEGINNRVSYLCTSLEMGRKRSSLSWSTNSLRTSPWSLASVPLPKEYANGITFLKIRLFAL